MTNSLAMLPFGTASLTKILEKSYFGMAYQAIGMAIKTFGLTMKAINLANQAIGLAILPCGTSDLPNVLTKRSFRKAT